MLKALVGAYTRRENDAQKARLSQAIGALIQHFTSLERRQDPQDPSQSSTTLLPSVIVPGFAQTGQGPQNAAFQVPSLISTNNFINFCSTVPELPITNGQQITATGSCNPAPMGQLPSNQHMPSTKIIVPKNGDFFAANTPFTVIISTQNLRTGNSVNALDNYFSAPQQLDFDGNIMGHYHIVIEELSSFDQKTVTDPTKFVFFKDMVSGLEADVTSGLPTGLYRLTVTTHTANHQPVLVPIAQHGSLNDAVYFTVTNPGAINIRNLKDPSVPSLPSVSRSAMKDVQISSSRFATPSRISRETRRKPLTVQGMRRALSPDVRTSTTLDPSVIASGFASDGQGNGLNSSTGVTASLTSINNFINFCATLSIPPTNGTQNSSGSCNSAPMGVLPSENNIVRCPLLLNKSLILSAEPLQPSVRFTFPSFNSTLPVDTSFHITLATANLATGQFTNPQSTYLAAPQQLSSDGKILGYVSIAIESVSSMDQTTPTDPRTFTFYQSIAQASDDNGLLSSRVQEGLPAGVYRLSSFVRAANHQPVLTPVLSHGSVDDVVYFSVAVNGSLLDNQTDPSSATTTSISTPSLMVPTISEAPLPNSTSKTSTGIAVGASLAAVVFVAIVLLLIWRFRKAQTRASESQFVIDEQPTLSVTPFTGRILGLPTYRALVNNRKERARNEVSDSNLRRMEVPFNSSQEAGPSKPNRRRERSRNRISNMSTAPSYHTTY